MAIVINEQLGDECYLAFDIGGTKISSAFVIFSSEHGVRVRDVSSIPTEAELGGENVKARLIAFAKNMLNKAKAEKILLSGIGIGSAGVVDEDEGEILTATSLMPGWGGQQIAKAFSSITSLPLRMVGDVGAHGLGEALYGAGKPYSSILSVGVGTGIGGAYINHGKLLFGAHGVAGHIGHIPHGLARGIECSCGSTCGHIESVSSGSGLVTLYNLRKTAQDSPIYSAKEISVRAGEGENLAKAVLAESGYALGECLAGLANSFDPDALILSGSVVNAGLIWWNAVKEGFRNGALPLVRETPLIEGSLGGSAPLIGAAAACKQYAK